MHLSVLIAVPSGISWFADFGMSLVNMVAFFANNKVDGYTSQELRVANVKGSILPTQRLNALKMAKQMKATHLLFIDSDHTFPPTSLHLLLSRNRSCVAANCVTKTLPAMTTARHKSNDPQGTPVYSDEGVHALEQVWRVGTGMMLLDRSVFSQIPHEAFAMYYKPDADTYQGEDWTMCEALEKADVKMFVDHDLSRHVGHIGALNYTHDYVGTLTQV